MKHLPILTFMLSSVLLASCVKAKTQVTKVDIPALKLTIPTAKKLTGLKCDLVGDNESKEVFLQFKEIEKRLTISFHDFTSGTSVSLVGAKFSGFSLMSFPMTRASEEAKDVYGETVLTHADLSQLSDTGNVLMITGRLTMNEDLSGKLEQKLMISHEDNSIETTPLVEIGSIENCQEFEASSF